MFDKGTYINRRLALCNQVTSGIVLLLGNEESAMNYTDNPYRFRQDSTFLYYFGISIPSLAAIIDADSGETILFGDDQTIDTIVWTGKLPSMHDYSVQCGVETVHPSVDLKRYIDEAMLVHRKVHYLPPYRPENREKLHHLLQIPMNGIGSGYSPELVKAVVDQREIKSEEEIVEIEKAVDVSVDMHVAAMKMARPGMLEHEIAAEVNRIPLAAGFNIAFPIIATINGQTLHNHSYNNRLKEGNMFLLDAGAESAMGYAGDLSSTFPVSRQFTPQQKEIYELTLKAHQTAIDTLAPDVRFMDVHLNVCHTIADGMKGIGLMKGSVEDAVAAGAHAIFFPCGTGHMMGLDVHDMEDLGEEWVGYDGEPKSKQFGLKSLRLGKTLKPGFVLTIEPGIYFIPDLIDRWMAEKTNRQFLNFDKLLQFRNFGGIRNEEDFLITPKGSRLLGKPCPKTIAEVEALR